MPDATLDATARDAVIAYADGDGAPPAEPGRAARRRGAGSGQEARSISTFVETTITRSLRRFDKGGEAFYDQISALHKSVRGSDPDASLYWFCRMLDGGADPLYVGRRMIRMASEDIGLADPRALAAHARRGRDLRAPGHARRRARAGRGGDLSRLRAPRATPSTSPTTRPARSSPRTARGPVPLHLRNAPTRLMKNLGYGKDYRYAHDEEDAYAAGETLSSRRHGRARWYRPTDRGLEAKIAERLADAAQSRRKSAVARRRQVVDPVFAASANGREGRARSRRPARGVC